MLPTGAFAVAAGIGFLLLIVALSLRGPRDRGGRLPGNGGPMIPYNDDGDGGDGG